MTPYEFVWLLLNAKFITTSSFHGTAFALQSGNPFISYVLSDHATDSRVSDLLRKCNAENHIVEIGEWREIDDFSKFESSNVQQKALSSFRQESNAWLRHQLEQF